MLPIELALLGAVAGNVVEGAELKLLPKPASIEMKQGFYMVPERVVCRVSKEGTAVSRTTLAHMASVSVKQKVHFKEESGVGWWLVVGNATVQDAPEGDEAYRLTVTPKGIALSASAKDGFRHGVRTFAQILAHGTAIPACEIDDSPALGLRGLMIHNPITVARPDGDIFFRALEDIAMWKMNALFLHITEHDGCSIELLSHPELPCKGAMTQDSARKLVARGQELGVQIIPEVESWGHAGWLVRHHKELAEGGSDFTVCLSQERTYELLEDVIREMAELFPSPYIHLGCDEASYAQDDPCKALAGKIGADRMIANHLNRLNRIAKKYSKTSMIWGDVILRSHRGAVPFLDPDIIIIDWNYRPNVGHEGLRWLEQSGLKSMAAPAITFSGWLISPTIHNLENIRRFAAHAKAEGSVGVESTIWGLVRCVPGSWDPAYASMGDSSWNPNGQSYRSCLRAYLKHRFEIEPTEQQVERMIRFLSVGMTNGRQELALWADAEALLKNTQSNIEIENDSYIKTVGGLAKELSRDLKHIEVRRDAFDSLVTTAAVGEHIALRRAVARDVVNAIRKAATDLDEGKQADAKSRIKVAAAAIRKMESEHARLSPKVHSLWGEYYGDNPVWWFTSESANAYSNELAAELERMAKEPDAEALRALLEVKK